MTFTISPGWWVVPLIVTVIMFGWAAYESSGYKPNGGMFDFNIAPLVYSAVALPVSLFAWLIWALVT